jgi:hypothetical protein
VPDDHAANDAEAGAVANLTEAEIDLSAAQADFDLLVLGGKRGHVEGGAGSGLFRFSADDFGYNHVLDFAPDDRLELDGVTRSGDGVSDVDVNGDRTVNASDQLGREHANGWLLEFDQLSVLLVGVFSIGSALIA